MNRLNRRRFLALGAASTASVVLVACGNESPADEDLNPTQIPDVAGAPPTLAPLTSTPQTESGGGSETEGDTGEGDTGGGSATAVEVSAVDIGFEPTALTIAPDTDVTITLVNNGMLQHDLVIEDTDYATEMLDGGGTGEIVVNLPEGEYIYFCSVPGHREAGMEGTLTVSADAAAAGGEETEEEAPAEEEEAAAAGGSGEAVTILALDSMAFDPSELEVSPGQTLTLQNDGFLQHDLAVDDWGGPLTALLNNGESEEFTIPDDAAVGESFEFYCSVPGHKEAGMTGTFTVVEAGAAAPAGDEEEAPAEDEAAEEEEAAAGAATTEGEGGSGEAVTILALDSMAFDPSELEVSPGQTLTLQNDGFLQHDLAVDDWGGPLTALLNNGESEEFTIPDDAAVGESFEFYCSVPGHKEAGMTGTFTVVEGGGGGAAAASAEDGEEEAAADEDASTPAAAAGEGDASDPMAVSVVATEWEFSPADFEVAPGGTITLVNEGTVAHGMMSDALDGEFIAPVGSGQEGEFTVPSDLQPGDTIEYTAVNSSASELGMGGTITIVEGDGSAAAASPAASPAATPEADEDSGAAGGSGGGDTLEVSAIDIAFEPEELTMAADTDVTINVVNNGMLQHDFVIEDTDFATEMLNGGDSEELTVNLPAGEYVYYCSVPGHREAGMTGTLTVE